MDSQLSFFPFSNSSGGLNIVSGTEAIAARILHLLLLQKGESLLYPDMGMAPDLFIPLSSESAYAFRYEAQQMLVKWGQRFREQGKDPGFKEIWVEATTDNGEIKLKITFTASYTDQTGSFVLDYQNLIQSRSDPSILLNSIEMLV